MKVCITRNDEANMNASLLRVTTALSELTDDICLLTRSRYSEADGIVKKSVRINNKELENYEISIKGKPAGGLKNISQLMTLEMKAIKWFFSNRKKYDVIHAFDLDMGLPAFITKVFLRKRYVYHIADFYADSRNSLPNFSKPLLRKLEHLVINNAESVIICTEERREQIKGSRPKELKVVHNTPILSDDLKQTIKDAEIHANEKIVFTYVGSLTERRFIKDIVEVISEEPRAELVIAGTGEVVDYVSEMADKHNNITFLGKIDYDDALKLYTESDVMFAIYDPTVPNHKYSAPNKVYEAMMTGKPIIVAKDTGIDSIVVDNEMGFSINYSKKAFEEVLTDIVERKVDLHRMGRNAEIAYPDYSWTEMKQKIKDIYTPIV